MRSSLWHRRVGSGVAGRPGGEQGAAGSAAALRGPGASAAGVATGARRRDVSGQLTEICPAAPGQAAAVRALLRCDAQAHPAALSHLATLPHPAARAGHDDDVMASVWLVWLGRRHIPGIEAGRMLSATGTLGLYDGAPAIYNPWYELRAVNGN